MKERQDGGTEQCQLKEGGEERKYRCIGKNVKRNVEKLERKIECQYKLIIFTVIIIIMSVFSFSFLLLYLF